MAVSDKDEEASSNGFHRVNESMSAAGLFRNRWFSFQLHTTMIKLPKELLDRFIDEFHDSVRDLKVLSLVCRPWLHRARYHLFRTLVLMPQDLQAIQDNYADVKRRASLPYIVDPDDYVTEQDEEFLQSPLAENPQPIQSFLSSITDTLPHVRGLRLLSFIQLGVSQIRAREYFHIWLGYGGDEYALRCRLRWMLSSNEEFLERQKARWDAVDLPWKHGTGLHALPFRNLRYIQVHWSVFSWTPPSENQLTGLDLPNSDHWPSYQLAMLVKFNAETLDHIFINEYPGFQLEQYGSSTVGDGLLDLLSTNAPNLQSLCLGGLRAPYYPHYHIDNPKGSDDFLTDDRALYPSGKEVPHVMSSDANRHREDSSNSSLERLFLQGFDSESTSLIEDALFNRGVFSLRRLRCLGFSVMPENYNYKFFLSKVRGSLTHLALDLDQSILDLKFSWFPHLECLSLNIRSTYYTWKSLHTMVRSLYEDAYYSDELGSKPAMRTWVRLFHVAFGPGVFDEAAQQYLIIASVDDMLESMVSPHSVSSESVGRSMVDTITIDIPETVLAKALPFTFQTGCLKHGKTDKWWFVPVYLR
ncbi:hypothetical protein EV360DRAFT_89263 [Lentinula raphanica]|nr:hypothetical protein EV360DRAFT_89263 [Lentinula raphanica]